MQDETRRKRNRADTEQRLINVALESSALMAFWPDLTSKRWPREQESIAATSITTLDPGRDLLRAAISQRFKLLVEKITAREQNLGFVKRRLRLSERR